MNPNFIENDSGVSNFCQVNSSRKPGYKVSVSSYYFRGCDAKLPQSFFVTRLFVTKLRLFKDRRDSLVFDWWFEVKG